MLTRSSVAVAVLTASVGLTAWGWDVAEAEACGCLSPPIPEFDDSEFAVNQQAEQIIFEVEPDGIHVTAHVLIRFAGRPEQFAWLVPAPTVPDFEIGSDAVFGLLDGLTAPVVTVSQPSLCPDPEFTCAYHDSPQCPFPDSEFDGNNAASPTDNFGGNNATNGGQNSPETPPVEVLKREQVGDYDTVVFTAAEAGLAVQWLNDNGFIVNDTMTPYMQPYLDAGMVFVASKLIAGATAEQIKPLKMRYESTKPMIPLQLTAVAAEPHLTVTAYVLNSGSYFAPENHPVVAINPADISTDANGRVNYPMVMARAIDEAGGDGFVIEYAGDVPAPVFDNCCEGGESDNCGIGFDGLCQCPLAGFDADDCGEQTDLVAGYTLLDELRTNYTHLSRITTRLSPEEMSFDPVFGPASTMPVQGRLQITGQRRQMWGCESDVIDRDLHDSVELLVDCASTYCGRGICAVDAAGEAGCICEGGFKARQFTDLDGAPSVTCVPQVGTVDLAAGGLTLPTACKPSTCGSGSCLDVGGFATCDCGATGLAVPNAQDSVPACRPSVLFTGDAGARDYTVPMDNVRACAPTPSNCGDFGWLVENPNIDIQGVVCPSSLPAQSRFTVPRKPTCDDIYPGYSDRFPGDPGVDSNFDGNPDAVADKEVGGGGCGGGDGCGTAAGGSGGFLVGLLALALARRRR